MILKLAILNMKEFFSVINSYTAAVYQIAADGNRCNIRCNYALQEQLKKEYQKERCFPITIDIRNTADYMNILSYYAGDC